MRSIKHLYHDSRTQQLTLKNFGYYIIKLNLLLLHFIPFPRFIPFSVFYPFFRVLSLFPRFIPFSAFYPFFRVLSLFPRFILFSAFYPFFRVLSLFPRFFLFSAFYPLSFTIYLEIVLSIKSTNQKHGGFDVTVSLFSWDHPLTTAHA